ncbi:erythromycin esterase family protein [Dyadobacter sp. CY343]|uniref:erythromycin esterase family protein n=1 Tax=Dyadobacter sp. CY343 TaxID=2907299 RepID=UPI001F2AC7DE|nr:erythromycin esterase family protein [Dyadobacter sp. CY343]MCE7062182.1 erythromycin esterase family protein [Dyadobacter sp. CY343]
MKLSSSILTFFLFLSTIHTFRADAQDNSLDWIDKNAHPISTDTTQNELSFLSEKLKGKTIVGLGEASHGTQEFFFQKRKIIQYLVTRENFRTIGFESPANFIEPLNKYIQSGEGNPKITLSSIGLYNADEILKLCEWLRQFNASRPAGKRVKMIGFDDEAFWGDPLGRDESMAEKFIALQKTDQHKSILWSHNLHLAKDTTMAQYKAMGFHLKAHYGRQYYALGMDTYAGSVHVLNGGQFESHDFKGPENSLSAVFSKAKPDAFFVDFIDAPAALKSAKDITNIYSNWKEPRVLPIVPGSDFDALIFIRETTASKPCAGSR